MDIDRKMGTSMNTKQHSTAEHHAARRHWLNSQESGYHKAMGNRQVQMIAIGGAIGTGLFLGAGARLQMAGPALALVYLVCGLFSFFILRALGELVLHVRGDISTPLPCTPRGVLELLDAYDIDLNGKEVCVLGRGITIGRTIGLMLTRNAVNATVTLCHTGTRDVADHMRRADVIVAAMGSAGFVTPDKIKDGAVLVDVGVSRVYDEEAGRYRIKGDVDKACYDKASAYTPNPGGVGPMTRAMLLANVVEMAERHA